MKEPAEDVGSYEMLFAIRRGAAHHKVTYQKLRWMVLFTLYILLRTTRRLQDLILLHVMIQPRAKTDATCICYNRTEHIQVQLSPVADPCPRASS